MTSFDMQLFGAAEIERKLAKLDIQMSRKIVRQSLRAGSIPIRQKMRDNARTMVGGNMGSLIAKNLATRAGKRKRGLYRLNTFTKGRSDVPEFVDVSADGTEQYIPAAIEWGHVDRAGGFVPAIPFARSAFDSRTAEAHKRIAAKLMEGIARAAKHG